MNARRSSFDDFIQKYGNDTTTNFQLIRYAKELNIKPFYYCMRDEIKTLKNKKKYFVIVNIHTTNQIGVHHSALFKNKTGEIFFFDSYGLDPTKEIVDLGINRFAGSGHDSRPQSDHFVRNSHPKILCSTFQIQKANEKWCGQLSLWVLYQLSLGKEFKHTILELVELF